MTRARSRVLRLLPSAAGGAVVATAALLLPLAPAHADDATAPPTPPAPPATAPVTAPPATPTPPAPASAPTAATPYSRPGSLLPMRAVVRPAQDQLSTVGGFAFTVFKRMASTMYEKVSLPVSVPTTGLIRTDCSGFSNYLLQKVSPKAYRSLVTVGRAPRPISATYAYVMRRSPSTWKNVGTVGALRNGDVIAWPQPRGKSAGHVMIVAEKATKVSARTWLVPIMDSTTQSHGLYDSRRVDPRALRNSSGRVGGLGTGYILLAVNAAGAPISYGWNPSSRERVTPTVISLGRPLG